MLVEQLNESKVQELGESLVGVANNAALALMISVGHKTWLFDIMATLPPSTSAAIALAAGLNERYVREWLGAMVTGRLVEYDPETREYWFPREHAALLTRAAQPNNMAPMMQFIGMMGAVEDRVVRCFHEGGGVSYCGFCGFHSVMAEESAQTVVAALEDHLLPLAPGLREELERGARVMDVGCGQARGIQKLARMFPRSSFLGIDFSADAIELARAAAADLPNVELQVADAATFRLPRTFDVIFAFDAIHDQARPDTVLSNIHASLKPGGLFFMQDIAASSHLEKNMDHPVGPYLYTVSCMHCMTVSLAHDGAGLGTVWGEELAVQMLREAGFAEVRVSKLPHDIINNYYIMRK